MSNQMTPKPNVICSSITSEQADGHVKRLFFYFIVRKNNCPVTDLRLLVSAMYIAGIKSQEGMKLYRGADKSLARTGRKQATATENFEFHISY